MAKEFVNLWQTKEERREKYWLMRSIGFNSYWASRFRDFRLCVLERKFGDKLGLKDHTTQSKLQS